MAKRLVICAVIFLVLFILGILAYTNLELYSRKVPVFPSRDVISNDYFALEHWLAQTGHPVRVEKRGSPSRIVSGNEKTVIVQASACSWENAGAILRPWIEGGGFLVISLEHDFYNDDLDDFIAGSGITLDDYAAGEEIADKGGPETADALADIESPLKETPGPDFDLFLEFFIDETRTANTGVKIFTIKDRTGAVRLARLPVGEGALVVIGRPLFMFNHNLERETNARLAWDLTGAWTTEENPGLLFIRNKRVTKGLLGKIADRGNFFPLAVSALVLIVFGFWMVIPVFGLTFSERQSKARPIKERFLAEIRFLKKYGALRTYLEIYIRELKLQGREGENIVMGIEQALQSGSPMKYRDIINGLRRLESLTERL